MNPNPRIVVVGSVNTDMVARAPALPAAGQTVLASSFHMGAGGKGANQAVAAARLGASVALVARVGDDVLGDRAIDSLAQDGIDTKYITRDPGAQSGVALIGVDEGTGENSILVAAGANGRLTAADVQAAADEIAAASVVMCQLEIPLAAVEAALCLAWSAGVLTVLDPSPAQKLSPELLARVSIITPNRQEATALTGEKDPARAGKKLVAAGAAMAIVTLGAEGALVVERDQSSRIAAGEGNRVVDTTAAGDCFNGALAVALAEGKPMALAVGFACRAAAVSVGRAGAQASLPYRHEVG